MEQHPGTGCRSEAHVSKSRGYPPTSSLTSADGMLVFVTAELQHDGMRFARPRDGCIHLGPSLGHQAATPAAGSVGPEAARSQGNPPPLTFPRPQLPRPAPTGAPSVSPRCWGSAREPWPRKPRRTRPTPSAPHAVAAARTETARRRRGAVPAPAPPRSCRSKAGLKSFHWGFFLGCRTWWAAGQGADREPGPLEAPGPLLKGWPLPRPCSRSGIAGRLAESKAAGHVRL